MIFTTQPILALALLLVSYASLSAAMCAPMGGIHGNQSNCVYSAPISARTDAAVEGGAGVAVAAAATATVSTAAHPLLLYGLQPYNASVSTETALTYGATPTASNVPGHPACYGLPSGTTCPYEQDGTSSSERRRRRDRRTPPWLLTASRAPLWESQINPSQPDATPFPADGSDVSARAAPAYGSDATAITTDDTTATTATITASASEDSTTAAASTTTCTQITGSSPTATIPSMCHPSLHVNAGGLAASRSATLATASVTVAAVANKVECCASCADIFNCVAWSFAPVYTQAPTPQQPGGFDPWARGSCVVLYHTGTDDYDDAGNATAGAAAPAVCPNGAVGSVLDTANGTSSNPGGWENVYYNGWNEGPCGAPADGWEEDGLDAGTGDAVCQ